MSAVAGTAGGRRVIVVTLDTLGTQMAGPAIRAWEISAHLAAEGHRVRLLTFGACDRSAESFGTAHVDVSGFRAEVDAAEIVIIQGYIAATFPWLRDVKQYLVIDLYDPFHLESLEVEKFRSLDERNAALARALLELDAQVSRGDFFVCASEKQRDLWIGHLAAAGRVNPLTYDADRSLRSLIDVVPFGTADEPAAQTRHAIKGAVPGIGSEDLVIVWGGGVYNWFDPLTVVRAVARAREAVPGLRLFFLGMRHPNPDVPEMAMATSTRAESDRLGLTGSTVFFHEDWVAYDDRVNYLMDADIGVSTHFDHVETAFSFRTRILDYLWAGLPIVCSQGDAFGELVAQEDLGAAVAVEDVDGLAQAIVTLVGDSQRTAEVRARVRRVAESFTWNRTLRPLVAFCAAPYRSADHETLRRSADAMSLTVGARIRRDVRATARVLREKGIRGVVGKVRWRMARGLGR